MRGNIVTLSVVAVMVLGIYVLPSVVASFATGTHVWELRNDTGSTNRSQYLKCGLCHTYIESAMDGSDVGVTGDKAVYVYNQHINASQSPSFMSTLGMSAVSDSSTVCVMCHASTSAVTGSHTNIQIRWCTDLLCHGNSSAYPGTAWDDVARVGAEMTNGSEVHSTWFDGINADNENASRACMGCHTHAGFVGTVRYWGNKTINMTELSDDWATSFINVSVSNATTGLLAKGTVSAWE